MSADTHLPSEQVSLVQPRTSRALPPEVAATILAVSATILGALLNLPIYGIFLGWAAAGLAGSSRGVPTRTLARCLAVGALFGAGALTAQAALGAALGPAVPMWVAAAAALATLNPLLILLGRTSAFRSAPAMFVGFSTLFAVNLGSTTPVTDSITGALCVGVLTNLTGLGCHRAFGRMTGRRHVARR